MKTVLAIGLLATTVSAQTMRPVEPPVRGDQPELNRYWSDLKFTPPVASSRVPWIQPEKSRKVSLDFAAMTAALAAAPVESGGVAADLIIALPTPHGGLAHFRVIESAVMAPELAALFPEIRTYVGQGIDDPSATLRMDVTPAGLHAQVLSPNGAFYVDPLWRDDNTQYACYFKSDYARGREPFSCELHPGAKGLLGGVAGSTSTSGDTLRTYRLAVAATGEYTQFHGGTVEAGMAAIVTAVNRINGIYETEVAVRMVLVPNNNLVVYTNGATDPYSNGNGGAMLSQNQSHLDARIGNANYDIGHVFSTGGGGVAGLGVVCFNNQKAFGVTGLSQPIGDPFYVDYVAHEMGHQFGANHSFNGTQGSCGGGNRFGPTAYEPGSGSSIMCYAGICGSDDLQEHSDPFFHSIGFDEIRAYIVNDIGNNCPTTSATGNDPPLVDAGPDYVIPRGTPFALTAAASDPNDDPLSFCWEERDLGPAAALSAPDDGRIPLFRPFSPTTDPTRFFPTIPTLLSNVPSLSEKIPTRDRVMNFRVTVRDNRLGGGGVAYDEMQLTVEDGAGPLAVSFPTSSADIIADSPLNVAWDVASTDLTPVNVSGVNLLLSTDDGASFPTVLAANTPNDGSETVMVPNVSTAAARVKVESVNNVFFAISGICPPTASPAAVFESAGTSRYLSFAPGNSGRQTALRVRLTSLPAPFNTFNGTTLWVGPPTEYSEMASRRLASEAPEAARFWGATLQCTPHFADWGALGAIHVYHVLIVPRGQYSIQVLDAVCDAGMASSFSASFSVAETAWGDLAGPFNIVGGFWSKADGRVDITTDVVATLEKFSNRPTAPGKVRADLEPGRPDQLLNISDVTRALDAFRNLPYPFPPPMTSPCS